MSQTKDLFINFLVFVLTIICMILVINLIMSGFFAAFPPTVNKIMIILALALAAFGPYALTAGRMAQKKFGHKPQIRPAGSIRQPVKQYQAKLTAQEFYNQIRDGGMPANQADQTMNEYFPNQPYQRY